MGFNEIEWFFSWWFTRPGQRLHNELDPPYAIYVAG